MISPVSFRATQTASAQTGETSFADKIRTPQTYINPNTASAASGISETGEKKKLPVKKILLGAGAAVLAAGALALGHNKGFFAVKDGGNKIFNNVKKGLDTVGKFVSEKAGAVKGLVAKKAPAAVEGAIEAAE